jgi:hypothetical protein
MNLPLRSVKLILNAQRDQLSNRRLPRSLRQRHSLLRVSLALATCTGDGQFSDGPSCAKSLVTGRIAARQFFACSISPRSVATHCAAKPPKVDSAFLASRG